MTMYGQFSFFYIAYTFLFGYKMVVYLRAVLLWIPAVVFKKLRFTFIMINNFA